MRNSKLYSILEYFDKYEQNRLRKFLISPYFNRNEALVSIFEQLIAHIKSGSEVEMDKEQMWSITYPDASFDDVLFRKNCSDLLKLIESYLAQQVYEENPIHKANYLIEGVAKKKMERLFKSTIRTARRLSEHELYRSVDFFLAQYHLETNYNTLIELSLDRTAKKNVEAILENLDRFFLAEKLRYACTIFSQQKLVSLEYELLFMDEVLTQVQKNDYESVPPIAVYHQIYLTYTEPEDTAHYFKLRELLDTYGELFPKQEAEFIYGATLNYCINKLNKGSQQFLEEYFNVFVILLDKGLLLVDGELSPWHYKNIITIALRLGKTNWTENFIYKYKPFLPSSLRDNAVTFNLAQLFMYKKEFEKVINTLQTVDYEDFTYNLTSKVMLMSSYFELDEIEALYSLMDSFRTYLNRHKEFAANKRIHYTNLIKFTKKLSRIMPGDKKEIEKLKADVAKAEEKGIASITWLKEKIAEIE